MSKRTQRIEMEILDTPLYDAHDFPGDDQRRVEQLIMVCGDANDAFLAGLSSLPEREAKREIVTCLRDAYLEGVKGLDEWIAALG